MERRAIKAQIEKEENRLIMAALFGRLGSLGRFSLLLQLRFQTEVEPTEGGSVKNVSSQGQKAADGLKLFIVRL